MGRRQQQMILKQVMAFDAAGLLKEIRREQQPIEPAAKPPESTVPQPAPTTRHGWIVGRQVLGTSLQSNLSEYFEGQTGVTYRPYVPTLMYATRALLQEAFGTPDYETPARGRLPAVRERSERAATSLRVPLESLVTQFHKSTARVSLAFSFEASDEKAYLYTERRTVIGTYSPEGQTRNMRQPLMLDVGHLSLSGHMRRRFDPAELHLNLPLPEHVELEAVDVVNLREPTKLL